MSRAGVPIPKGSQLVWHGHCPCLVRFVSLLVHGDSIASEANDLRQPSVLLTARAMDYLGVTFFPSPLNPRLGDEQAGKHPSTLAGPVPHSPLMRRQLHLVINANLDLRPEGAAIPSGSESHHIDAPEVALTLTSG